MLPSDSSGVRRAWRLLLCSSFWNLSLSFITNEELSIIFFFLLCLCGDFFAFEVSQKQKGNRSRLAKYKIQQGIVVVINFKGLGH